MKTVCPIKLLEALEKDAAFVTQTVNTLIHGIPHPVFQSIPEDRRIAEPVQNGNFEDFDIKPKSSVICLTELSTKGEEYLQQFFKTFMASYTNWGTGYLKDALENFLIRYSGSGRLALPTEKFPGGDDSVRGYFKPSEGHGIHQFIRVYPWQFDDLVSLVRLNPSYGRTEVVVEGVEYPLCRLVFNTHPESFRRCGRSEGGLYFHVSVWDNNAFEESGPGKIRLFARHQFRIALDKPELSSVTAYLP